MSNGVPSDPPYALWIDPDEENHRIYVWPYRQVTGTLADAEGDWLPYDKEELTRD